MTFTRVLAILLVAAFSRPAHTSEYTTFIGDSSDYQVARIRTDSLGNTYIGGTRSSGSLSEIFVMKLDPAGKVLLFSAFSGKDGDAVADLAIDAAGNLYLAGGTSSVNFPLHNAFQATPGPGFLVKLSPDASQTIYSTYFPAAISALAVDGSGNAYVTGSTFSSTFPVTPGLPAGTPSNGVAATSGAFVTKLSAAGDRIVYSSLLVGQSKNCGSGSSCFLSGRNTVGVAIAVDAAGNAYIAGNTDTYDLPVTAGALLTQGVGAFVAKINAAGTVLSYLTYVGPTYYPLAPYTNPANSASDLAVDAAGNAYITGSTSDPLFPATAGAYQTALAGSAGTNLSPPPHAFVLKLKPDGSAAVWGSYLGGKAADSGRSLALDASGNVWITGTTASPDFPNAQGWSQGGDFMSGFSPSGASLTYSARYPNGSVSRSIAADASGLLHSAGATGIVSVIAPGQTPVSRIFGIANAAFGPVSGHISPQEVISIYGPHIGPATPASFAPTSAGFVPTSLAGVQVLMSDYALPLLYVSDSQINAVAPSSLYSNTGAITLHLSTNGAAGPEFPVASLQADAQIFRNPDGTAAAVNQDGTLNSAGHPAPAGSIVAIWATGVGLSSGYFQDGQIPTAAQNSYPVVVYAGPMGMPAEVRYAGPSPGIVAGVVQINFVVPATTSDTGGAIPVTVLAGARLSSQVTLFVK
jgi:uncharacterized protein (TIGR03437 family)